MSQFSLLSQRKFWPLFWTQFLGAFNDNLFKNALVCLLSFRLAPSLGISVPKMVSICGGVFIFPFFLFSATGGQLADKYSKSTLIRWIKFSEIIIMLIGALGFFLESIPILLSTLFLTGAQSALFGPAKYSSLPQLLEKNELVRGNALVESGTMLAILFGLISGTLSYSLGNFAMASGILIVAIVGWLCSRQIPHIPPTGASIKISFNPLKPTIEIINFCRKDREIQNCILGISWFWFIGAAAITLFPSLAIEVFQSGEWIFTYMMVLFCVGVSLGSLLYAKLARNEIKLHLVPLGAIGLSVFALDVNWISTGSFDLFNFARLSIDLVGFSTCGGLYIVPLYSAIQNYGKPSILSRLIAGNNILNSLYMVFASLWLIQMAHWKIPAQKSFAALGLLNFLAFLGLAIRDQRFRLGLLQKVPFRAKK